MNEYQKAVVLGLGISGFAAAKLLAGEGTEVTVLDGGDNEGLRDKASALEVLGVKVMLGRDDLPEECFDLCVVSPGIKCDAPILRQVTAAGIEVLSELELGSSRCVNPIIGITGTNGKSTLTRLCADLLRCGGFSAKEGGNYGKALCDVVMEGEGDWNVVEVSSFQLEHVKNFRPSVGVLLNIQPDHIDRHGSMEEYMKIKSRLFSMMQSSDTGLANAGCLKDVMKVSVGSNKWVSFGQGGGVDYGYADGVVFCANENEAVSVKGSYFENDILGITAAAATGVAAKCGLDVKVVEKAVREFKVLPHRMMLVREIDGVQFVDDSKATNLAALDAGVKMCDGPVRLIAGGQLKEKNLEWVKELLAKNVKKVYLIGEAAPQMRDNWQDSVDCCDCGELERAVNTAWSEAGKGDVVLLSPGCASFDQFRNFEERGNKFIEIVEDICIDDRSNKNKE
ncbi:UDP-N-acetylmuramoyl-L-alanine--D-glutamate ligase [bacterium B17]|nr:UDP-N-acetylmuramoyl-L-alanine--D-glutamate ligase [bacterium B17]